MKKDDYLAVLEEKLAVLSQEEREEKIHYYSDFFDDFGDDEKAALALGDPENLALSILSTETQISKNQGTVEVAADSQCEKLYWEFSSDAVKSLSLHLGSVNAVIVPGKKFSVETRGFSSEEINCFIDKSGSLTVQNSKVIPGLSYFSHSHDNGRHFYPRILITVPENAEIYSFSVGIGAGSLKSHKIDLKYQTADIQVFAGNLKLSHLIGEKTSIRCAFGKVELDGRFSVNTNIDNFLGEVTVNTSARAGNCSLDSRSVLGKIGWGEEKIELVGTKKIDGTGGNRFSVNCVFAFTDFVFF